MEDIIDAILWGLLVLFILFMVCAFGHSVATNALQSKAVELGHAEWVIVDSEGETEFKWKEVCHE